MIPIRWKRRDNINVAKMRARTLSIRARSRQAALHRQRYLHSVDSQVCLDQASKGRTGSVRMSYHLRRSSAVLLSCGLRGINDY